MALQLDELPCMLHFPLHARSSSSLSFQRLFAFCQTLSEFITETALLSMENAIFLQLFTASDSYTPSVSLP